MGVGDFTLSDQLLSNYHAKFVSFCLAIAIVKLISAGRIMSLPDDAVPKLEFMALCLQFRRSENGSGQS